MNEAMMTVAKSRTSLTAAARELRPEVALVLGSGLGRVAERVDVRQHWPFHAIDGLAATSIETHKGRVALGIWANRRVLLFEGRLHYYEGHDWTTVVEPMVLASRLGVQQVILTNAAGGIRDDLVPGSLMVLRDHLEWTRPYCWREPAKASPYSAPLRERLEEAARVLGIPLTSGLYAAVTGPNYETPAEIRALRSLGADCVGMSTAREAARAAALGLGCLAISCITNRAAGLADTPITHDEVVVNAGSACDRLADLLEAFLTS
ncbi:MAG: purine-nucleoside phosphorylase [Gemmataceae bacterium]